MCDTIRNAPLHLVMWSEENSDLHKAAVDGDVDKLSDLVYVGDANTLNNFGCTPLHHACMYGHVDITRLLLSVFARTDIEDDYRRTPVMMAEYSGNFEVAPYLHYQLPVGLSNVEDDASISSISTRVSESNHNVVSHITRFSTPQLSPPKQNRSNKAKVV
jgi:ankyrin repeat protein